MTFHLGWQQRKVCDSRLPTHSWGIPPVQLWDRACFQQNWGGEREKKREKVCKYDQMQKSREQLEVNCLSIKGSVRVSAAAATAAEASRRNPGTKSKLAFCVCSDVKFCHILVPLPPLAASVSQRIRLQSSSARGAFVLPCHSLGEEALTDPPLSRCILG